jgi:hypothetical protein
VNLVLTPIQLKAQTEAMIEAIILIGAFLILDFAALRWGRDSRDLLRPTGSI